MLTKDYIDRARSLTDTRSDYALARLLGISDDAVRQYRLGTRIIDNDTALELARVLKINVGEIIAAAGIERAKTPEQKQKWRTELKRFASIASASLLALILTPTTGAHAYHKGKTNYTEWECTHRENDGAAKLFEVSTKQSTNYTHPKWSQQIRQWLKRLQCWPAGFAVRPA